MYKIIETQQALKKKKKLSQLFSYPFIRPLRNTARFLWPVGDLINGIPLYYQNECVEKFHAMISYCRYEISFQITKRPRPKDIG